ncbi:MAG: T9SS type A sorting domain-containing protein [Chitinophagales bacterium]|nr:T9SS type A sorting domain-containing protein [Chitinophagales bacterium]
MKKIASIILALTILHTLQIFAQPCGAHFSGPGVCLDLIPTEAIIVSSDLSVAAVVNQCYWVCSGVTLSIGAISSGNLNIDMEANSTLNFSGNESTIWAKEGCTINIAACMPIIRIKMEPDVDVNFDAGGASCIVMDTCEIVVFDYLEAPIGGCVVGIQENENPPNQFTVYPNPVHDILQIEFANNLSVELVAEISDLNGKIILRKHIPVTNYKVISLKLPATAKGIYILSIDELSHKLIAIE